MIKQAVTQAGKASPLGATFDGQGCNFSLYSAHASAVELCIFDSVSHNEIVRYELTNVTNDIWHGYIAGIGPGTLYGYRVYGDYAPKNGLWFNPAKLLLDPFARKLSGSLHIHELHYPYQNGTKPLAGKMDNRDNASVMPKCVVVADELPHYIPENLGGPGLIYEAHVKGLTQQFKALEASARGTYAGLADCHLIQHLQTIQVDTLELMPIHAFCDEPHLQEKELSNYWGYNSYHFFCLHADYAFNQQGALDEFKQSVAKLKRAGIKVILDVVYNHTAEGNEYGPMLSFKGIDAKSYYRINDNGEFINHSGCGNTLNVSHPQSLNLILSSLRYWVGNVGIDGFRFDLAPILGRNQMDIYARDSAFFQAIAQDPLLSRVHLIAEPWDIGMGGYQCGNFPPPFAEWNDKYRDTMRAFWRGDEAILPAFSNMLLGSSLEFEHSVKGRPSSSSVNFISSHDGFTLQDLVSFNEKHNQANKEENRDGHSHNLSYNYGVEGDTEDDRILSLRQQQRRNLIATLLLSQGSPMLLAGDENGNSQKGNNNAYCQDNPIGWLDWSQADYDVQLNDFVAQLAKFRKTQSLLTETRYIHEQPWHDMADLPKAHWYHVNGYIMQDDNWHEQALQALGLLLVQSPYAHNKTGYRQLMIWCNASEINYTIECKHLPLGQDAKIILDTQFEKSFIYTPLTKTFTLTARSVIVIGSNT